VIGRERRPHGVSSPEQPSDRTGGRLEDVFGNTLEQAAEDWSALSNMENLVRDFLEHTAERLGDKTALVYDGARFTYGALDASANRLANALIGAGIRRGDRVAVYLNNSVEAVVAIFAALKANAAFVVINHTTKRDKLHYILKNCAAAALVADAGADLDTLEVGQEPDWTSLRTVVLCGAAAEQVAGGRPGWLLFDDIQQACPATRPRSTAIDLDLACLIYTSGSTGDPKGVMSDHSNIVFASGSIIAYLENRESDIVINVLPLSFDYGLYQLLMTFRFGGTLVLERSFAYPAALLQVMVRERVTGFPGVPSIYSKLVSMDLSSYDLSSLRYLTNTAAALPVEHIREIRRKFPWARLYSMYGLTETKRTLYLPPEQLDTRPGSVGIPIPGTEVWVEDAQGNRLGPNQVGELVVRGRHVMRGYWQSPEATSRRYRPGPISGERLCYTGDLFRQDDEGYFYFVGRSDDIIKSRGEKVAPKEIENVIYQLADVSEVAVIGVPDSFQGQAIKAIIVPRVESLSAAQVLAHCKRHLEDYMIPKYVEFRNDLPKTESGKIKKTGLI